MSAPLPPGQRFHLKFAQYDLYRTRGRVAETKISEFALFLGGDITPEASDERSAFAQLQLISNQTDRSRAAIS
jgi:hypothetical protein